MGALKLESPLLFRVHSHVLYIPAELIAARFMLLRYIDLQCTSITGAYRKHRHHNIHIHIHPQLSNQTQLSLLSSSVCVPCDHLPSSDFFSSLDPCTPPGYFLSNTVVRQRPIIQKAMAESQSPVGAAQQRALSQSQTPSSATALPSGNQSAPGQPSTTEQQAENNVTAPGNAQATSSGNTGGDQTQVKQEASEDVKMEGTEETTHKETQQAGSAALPAQTAEAAALQQEIDHTLPPTKKATVLREFLGKMDDYAPIVRSDPQI